MESIEELMKLDKIELTKPVKKVEVRSRTENKKL